MVCVQKSPDRNSGLRDDLYLCMQTFSHPDCTVGSGFSPDQPLQKAHGLSFLSITAGGEFHPALKIIGSL